MNRYSIVSGTLLLILTGTGFVTAAGDPSASGGSILHLVLFRFKEDAAPEAIEALLREFERLPAKVPGIRGFQWGTDDSPEGLAKGFTHGFVITLENAAARDAYLPHPGHQAFVDIARPLIEKVFVIDIDAGEAPPPAEPGRVHHLVFFKYREGASAEQVAGVEKEFAALPVEIPGLMSYRGGRNNSPEGLDAGFTHGHFLTFINPDARDDYLKHPAHQAFGGKLRPILEDVLVLDFTVRPQGRSLLVTGGVEPYAVLQRNVQGTAAMRFTGIASGDGPIEARLLHGRRVVEGFEWQTVGKAAGGKFEGQLAGVPAGGEYALELRRRDPLGNVAEVTDVAHLLAGDLWILAGQSNMEGYGDLVNSPWGKEKPVPRVDDDRGHPLVHCFTMAHRWELAVEPLHWLIDSRDPVHLGDLLRGLDEAGRARARAESRRSRTKGAGLGLPFAQWMVQYTGVPVGLIASAHGGTSMQQWDPAGKDRGGESLYGSMLKQVRRAGGRVKGVLWYQGESDANAEAAPLFAERFRALVAAFRADLGDPELPFYYVQLGRFTVDRPPEHWNAIQELQRKLADEIPRAAMVPAVDLELDDPIHIGTDGLMTLGARLANVAQRELFGYTWIDTGPRLAGIRLEDGGRAVRIAYSGVNGSLLPDGRVMGFSIRKPDGADLHLIFEASVDSEKPSSVVLSLRGEPPAEAVLWYGHGLDPACNLVDEQDMAAPVFGPAKLK